MTIGLLFRISQVFRGIELYADGLILFVAVYLTLPSLILIVVGLYFWVREKRLKGFPRARKTVDVFLVIAAVTVVTYIVSNPLRQSVEDIEKALLEEIPIGTPMEEARLHFIKDESVPIKERNGIVDLGEGKYWQTFHVTNYKYIPEISLHLEEGGSGYRVGLGNYRGFPWLVMVSATLVFDPDQKLKYVTVQKLQDAL